MDSCHDVLWPTFGTIVKTLHSFFSAHHFNKWSKKELHKDDHNDDAVTQTTAKVIIKK